MSRLPDYDRRDGNPFEWILRTAAEVRADRKAERLVDLAAKQASTRAQAAHDAAIEKEDADRIRNIRIKYARKGRVATCEVVDNRGREAPQLPDRAQRSPDCDTGRSPEESGA